METNLADRLDRSIPTPTDEVGLADLLADGRQALRRRRSGALVASIAAVVAVAGSVALTLDRTVAPETAPPVMSDPTDTPSPGPESLTAVKVPTCPSVAPSTSIPESALPCALGGDVGPQPGETRPSPAEVEAAEAPHAIFWFDELDHAMTTNGAVGMHGTHITVNNPWRLEAPANSGAVSAIFQGHTWWVVAYLLEDGSTGTRVTWAGDAGGMSFGDWVRAQEDQVLGGGASGETPGSSGAAAEGGAGGR